MVWKNLFTQKKNKKKGVMYGDNTEHKHEMPSVLPGIPTTPVEQMTFRDVRLLQHLAEGRPNSRMIDLFLTSLSVCHTVLPKFSECAVDHLHGFVWKKRKKKQKARSLKTLPCPLQVQLLFFFFALFFVWPIFMHTHSIHTATHTQWHTVSGWHTVSECDTHSGWVTEWHTHQWVSDTQTTQSIISKRTPTATHTNQLHGLLNTHTQLH